MALFNNFHPITGRMANKEGTNDTKPYIYVLNMG
jgi:hypothetical protein